MIYAIVAFLSFLLGRWTRREKPKFDYIPTWGHPVNHKRGEKAFTLIELLIVIMVIGCIAMLVAVSAWKTLMVTTILSVVVIYRACKR